MMLLPCLIFWLALLHQSKASMEPRPWISLPHTFSPCRLLLAVTGQCVSNHLWCYQRNISHTFTVHRHIHRVLWQGQRGWLLPDSSRSQREPSYFYLCIFSNHGILFLQILFYHTRLFCQAAPACLYMLLHLLPTISTAPS